jgi:hypothetical protein
MALKRFGNGVEQAAELAHMDMPRRYGMAINYDLSWRDRLATALTGRFLATPGRRARTGEITYRGRRAPQLLSTLGSIGEFRESPVSLDTLDLMRKHPMVKLGLVVRASPIMTALREARVECDDPKIAAFIKAVFVDRVMMDLAHSSIIPSYIFGVAPHEKVWTTEKIEVNYVDEMGNQKHAFSGNALIYKKIKFVHPMTLERFLINAKTQDFEGFEQNPPEGKTKPGVVDWWKAFVYTNKFLYGGFYGEAELEDVYAHWYYSEFFRALQADYLQYKAVPPIIGRAPPGTTTDADGEEHDNMVMAGEILQRAYDSLVVVLPSVRDEKGNEEWDYKELMLSERGDVYLKAVEDLDVMILRGLIVPERTVTQDRAAVGSYNQAAIHAERMIDMAKLEIDQFVAAINKWCIPSLVEDNFGAQAPRCEVFVRSVSENLQQKLYNIVITILQNDKNDIFANMVNFVELLDFLNIPFTVNENGVPEPQLPEETGDGETDDGGDGASDDKTKQTP